MKIKETFKKEWPFMLLFACNILAVFYFYSSLPDVVPTHWNIRGEVDGWGPKGTMFFLSALPLGIYLLMTILPAIDPKRRNYDQFKRSYLMVKIILGLLFSAIVAVTLSSSLGVGFNFGRMIPAIFGVFFVVLGNYLSTVKQNYFLGIRTPWTLSSKENWDRTHRMAGKLWVVAGILIVAASLFGFAVGAFVILMIAAFLPMIYSFILFKKGI